MKKIILTSHGSLAEGMKSAVKMILGSDEICEAFGLDIYGEPENIYNMIHAQIKEQKETQFIIFTDINGGSVQNQMLQLCIYPNVYVQTGMCLPMVLEACLGSDDEGIDKMMNRIRKACQDNMLGFSKSTIIQSEEECLW